MTNNCKTCGGTGRQPQTIEQKIEEIFSPMAYPLYTKVIVRRNDRLVWSFFNYDYEISYCKSDRTEYSGDDMITTDVAEALYKLGLIIVNVGPSSTWVRRV